MADEEEQCR
jgi:protein farnesyltransferase subunit beta